LAWDQLVYELSALAVVLCCARAISWRRGLALGCVLGLALSSHLMVAPLVVLLGLVLAAEHRREPGALLRFGGATIAAVLVVNVPYLAFLARARVVPGVAAEETHDLLTRALEPARAASLWRIEYFFDGDWPRFLASLGLGRGWTAIAMTTLVACAALSFVGILLMVTRARSEGHERAVRRVGILAGATAAGYALFYASRLLSLEPHYQFATWWLVPVGVAGALALLPAVAARIAYGATWLVALGQLMFVVAATRYLHGETGTRGVHYGPPVGHQAEVLRAICGATKVGDTAAISNQTNVFRGSLEYLGRTEPACAGRGVRLYRGPRPVDLPVGTLERHLVYRDETGGALRVTDGTSDQ
jgi:hypothetical protein